MQHLKYFLKFKILEIVEVLLNLSQAKDNNKFYLYILIQKNFKSIT